MRCWCNKFCKMKISNRDRNFQPQTAVTLFQLQPPVNRISFGESHIDPYFSSQTVAVPLFKNVYRKMKIERSRNIFQIFKTKKNRPVHIVFKNVFKSSRSYRNTAAVPEGPEGLLPRKSQTVMQSVQVRGSPRGGTWIDSKTFSILYPKKSDPGKSALSRSLLGDRGSYSGFSALLPFALVLSTLRPTISKNGPPKFSTF